MAAIFLPYCDVKTYYLKWIKKIYKKEVASFQEFKEICNLLPDQTKKKEILSQKMLKRYNKLQVG